MRQTPVILFFRASPLRTTFSSSVRSSDRAAAGVFDFTEVSLNIPLNLSPLQMRNNVKRPSVVEGKDIAYGIEGERSGFLFVPLPFPSSSFGPKEKEIRDAWVIEDRQRRLMYDSSERLERKKTRPELLLLDLGNLVKRGLKLWN